MADNTHIQWADATWNVATGCSKVSPGCKNCYMYREYPRLKGLGQKSYQKTPFEVTLVHDMLTKPLHWKKPRRIFVCSMSDLFHEDIPDDFIDEVFAIAALCPQHQFLILTKRPERMAEWFAKDRGLEDTEMQVLRAAEFLGDVRFAGTPEARCWPGWPLFNVWLGTSVENQDYIWRLGELMKCPAAVRFCSYEPALGPVDLKPYMPLIGERCWDGGFCHHRCENQCWRKTQEMSLTNPVPQLSWVIVGGESGPKARPSHPDWFRTVRDDCQAAGVPFFMKQWGNLMPVGQMLKGQWEFADETKRGPLPWGEPQRPLGPFTHNPILSINGKILPTQGNPSSYPEKTVFFARMKSKAAAGALLDGCAWLEWPGEEREKAEVMA